MDVLILQKPSAAALALSPQCPELSHRDPLATAYGPTSPAAKPWAAVPLVVPVTANTSPGRQHSPPLRPPAQTVPGTHSRAGPQHRGWPEPCRPALYLPEGPICWPGRGYQCQEGELEGQTNRTGGWREFTPSSGPCSAQKQPLVGASLPFPLSFPVCSAHAQESSIPTYLVLQSQPSLSQPQASPGLPKFPFWGSRDSVSSGTWLGAVSI